MRIAIFTIVLVASFIFAGCIQEMQEKCEELGGTWIEGAEECEGISESECIGLGGNYIECTSTCRDDPSVENCTQQCVQVCELGEMDESTAEEEGMSPEECVQLGGRTVATTGGTGCNENESSAGEVTGFVSPAICCVPKEVGTLCEDMCGDGVCQRVVCMGKGCPCPETEESCPEDCSIPEEAMEAARNSECGEEGELSGTYMYNENSKTWWIGLELYEPNPNCNPACVVYTENMSAEINWRCTGLVFTYVFVTPEEAKTMIEQKENLAIIDVSPAYEQGHIPGAVNYPYGTAEFEEALETLDIDAEYLVYCHSTSVAVAAGEDMVDANFHNVFVLEGNYGAWVEAGYEVETG